MYKEEYRKCMDIDLGCKGLKIYKLLIDKNYTRNLSAEPPHRVTSCQNYM